MPGFIESAAEASVGGFQGIKKVRGLFVKLDGPVPPPASWSGENNKQQLVAYLEDATVLEMFGGEEIIELKDNKFNFYIPYAEEGKVPNANSIYIKGWVASAEEVGKKKPSQFVGEYVTFEKTIRVLFKKPQIDPATKKPVLDAEGKKILEEIKTVDSNGRPNHLFFVPDSGQDSGDVKNYIKGILVGLNKQAALRKLMVDGRAKQFPEYKDKLKDGTLAAELGLTLVDEVFTAPKEG